MNTRRRALSDGCSAFNSARAAATSGRFCSAACRVFFEGDIVTLIESPDRAPPGLELLFAGKPRADLVERQVGLRSDEVEQPPLMRLERRAAMAGARLRRDASRVRPAFEPADRSRNANIEQTCRFSPALACLDHTDHPSPKIVRVSLRHRAPATIDAEPESDLRPRRKPPSSLRFTSSGKCSSRMAAARGHGVYFLSLEMSEQEITARLIADQAYDGDPKSPIPYERIQNSKLSNEEYERVVFAEREFR